MKGLFIPEITAEMFKNGCLESIESLMADGEIYDIDYPLKQEPCEDAISRQAVLDLVEADWKYENLEVPVASLPPVTPQPKTGHWINRHIIANTSIDMVVCSECGEEFSYDAETGISEYNYCPNCGAKMEREDKE